MTQDKEAFLERWSRLKQEQANDKAELPVQTPEKKEDSAAALPPIEALKPDSDFTPFMNPKVDDGTRRAALKKLFADSRFNVPDPFEAYSEDYTNGEHVPIEMLKKLERARKLLFEEPEKTAQSATGQPASQPTSPPQDPKDVAGKQDA